MVNATMLLIVRDFHNKTEGIKGHYIYRVDEEKRQRKTALLSELKIAQSRTQKKKRFQ